MSKGFDFERKKCKWLSLWWSDQKNEDIFWRTSQSGGRATQAKRKTLKEYGDMKAEDPAGQEAIDFALWEFKKGFTSMGRLKPGALNELNYEVQKLGLKAFVPGRSKKGNITQTPFVSKISGFLKKLKKSGKFDIMDFIDSTTKKDPLFWTWWEEAERDRKASKRPWVIMLIERDGKRPLVAIREKLYRQAMEFSEMSDILSIVSLYHKDDLIYFIPAEPFFNHVLTPDAVKYLMSIHRVNNPPKRLKRRRKNK